jgi:hypothetical protein
VRLEQVVLYGPGDDERIRFGPKVTVFTGLGREDRREVIETVVGALTGRVTTASVVFSDADGRRVFADRTGATYADSGTTAPGPSELVGTDIDAATRLLSVDANDLGLGPRLSVAELTEQLEVARAELEALHARHLNVVERTRQLDDWRAELAELDRRIATADDEAARWRWMQKRRELDEARAELSMIDRGPSETTDSQLLAAVEALRTAGATWADLAAEVSELETELGPIPDVTPEGLARVAATPDDLPAGFAGRLNAWRAAADADRAAQAVRAEAAGPVARPADPLVADFAELDQARLWAAHAKLVSAIEAYNAASATGPQNETDSEAENAVEVAHLEVVRAQRRLERFFRPAIAGIATLVLSPLLFIGTTFFFVTPLLLAAALALCWYLIVVPRRELDEAHKAEEAALSHTDAGSWLGLHLRRLDAVTDAVERKRFEVAANRQVAALVDWEEVAGARSVDDLTARAEAVKAYAKVIDPKGVARRREESKAHAETSAAAERSARRALVAGLESYGLSPEDAAALHPDALLDTLNRHIEAGRLARKAQKLRVLRGREREAANRLHGLLVRLGFDGDELATRLERAISAVTAARQRQALGRDARDRSEVEAEIARLARVVDAEARPGWTTTPDPTRAPIDPELLEARRREVSELVVAGGRPDAVSAERQYQLGLAKVRDLESEIEGIAEQSSVTDRFVARLRRNAKVGNAAEPIPMILDDPFRDLPVADHLAMLDRLVELGNHVQLVLLSADPLVARWAKDRVPHGSVVLFEAETVPETTIDRSALVSR